MIVNEMLIKKKKIVLEFEINTSASLLYQFLATPSGLLEWFADNVELREGIFIFDWSGDEEKAILLENEPDEFIRLQWLEDVDSEYYFEFRIVEDDVTKDLSLVIIDFSTSEELEDSTMFWDSQVQNLKRILGASTN